MHAMTPKFRSNLDANWQRKSRARSSSHYKPTITFCWNKIRQRSAFSKRSTYFWRGRMETTSALGLKADIRAALMYVRYSPKSGHRETLLGLSASCKSRHLVTEGNVLVQ